MKWYLNSILAAALILLPRVALAAGAAHDGEEGGGTLFDLLGIEWQGILVQIIGFLILFWLLKKFLFGPLQGAMNNRREEIQSIYDRLDEEQRALEAQRVELDQRLTNIEAEARQRFQVAANDARELHDQLLREAREQADRILAQGRQALRVEQEQALVQLREEVADLAMRAAGRILDEDLNDDRHRRLVDHFIAQVGN